MWSTGANRPAVRIDASPHDTLLTRPVLVIPMLPNQFPDASGQTEAVTVDISTTGLSLLIPQTERLPSRHWVVGIEAENQRLHYASCELRNVATIPKKDRDWVCGFCLVNATC